MSSITQRAVAARQSRERPQPVFVARAKVNGGWQTIGAAWKFRSGEPGLSVQLNTLPINFDGRFVLLEPLDNGEGGEPADPEPEPAQPRSRARTRSTGTAIGIAVGGKDEIPF